MQETYDVYLQEDSKRNLDHFMDTPKNVYQIEFIIPLRNQEINVQWYEVYGKKFESRLNQFREMILESFGMENNYSLILNYQSNISKEF